MFIKLRVDLTGKKKKKKHISQKMSMQMDLNIALGENKEPLTLLFALQEVEETIGTEGT